MWHLKTALPLVLLCIAPAFLRGQVNGSISGEVRDQSGALVNGAQTTITNTATAVSQSTATNTQGAYSFLSLPVGTYQLSVQAPGFSTYKRTDIVLNAGDELRVDVGLTVGQVNQQVEVSATAVHVEVDNTQLGDVISGSHIDAMPLNGRQFTDLLGLQAGVVPVQSAQSTTYSNYFGTTETGNISINGERETANGFLINGTNVDDSVNNGTTVIPNLDSIQEFRVLTSNFDAEYGNYSGGLVTVVTKSGSNQFHGDAFDFLRNTVFDARSFFDPTVTAFQQNQFGGTFGGPILHNHLFFFMDYQGTRNNIGQGTGAVQVPTLAERSGDFSAIASQMTGTVGGSYWAGLLSRELGYAVTNGEAYYAPGCASTTVCVFPNGIISRSAFSAPANALMKYIPLPNAGPSLFTSSANTVHGQDDLGSGRIDFSSSRWGTVSGYYFIDNTSSITPFGTNNTPGFPTLNGGRSQLYTLSDIKSLGPTALNELHLGFNRHVYHNNQPTNAFTTLANLGFNENQPGGIVDAAGSEEGVPSIGFNSFGIGMTGVNYNRYEDTPTVADNFSKVIGNHTVKIGGEYLFNDFYEPMPLVGGNGFFSFSGTETGVDFADFLIGAPAGFVEEGGFNIDNRRNYVGAFGQDSWRVTPHLVVNYGVRWDVIQPWYEKHNQASTFVPGIQSSVYPGAPRGYLFPGDKVPGYGTIPNTIARTDWHNFSPRLGIAYSPSFTGFLGAIFGGPDKISIRAGWGRFFTNLEGALEINESGLAPFDIYYPAPLPVVFASPYTNRVDGGQHQPFPFSTANFNWSLALPLNGYATPPIDQKVPYSENYFFTYQRQIANSSVFSLGYVGNQGHHLLTQLDTNPGNPALCLSLSQPSEVIPGSPTCGPFLENSTFTRANGTVVNTTRNPIYGSAFGDNGYFATVANSVFNSLQASYQLHTNRSSIVVGYTFSKSLDDSSNLQDKGPNPLNMRLSRGLSSFDVTHNFVVSYSYDLGLERITGNHLRLLVAGWKLVGITHLATGFPIELFETDDHSLLGDAFSADTPDFFGGNLNFQNPRKANATTGIPYFNTALFAPSQIGYEGTANRAFFHGPGLNNFDMSLLKDLQFSERLKAEFRAEWFNVFNHAQFNNPNGNVDSGPSVFGVITSARPGRIGQLALKVYF